MNETIIIWLMEHPKFITAVAIIGFFYFFTLLTLIYLELRHHNHREDIKASIEEDEFRRKNNPFKEPR